MQSHRDIIKRFGGIRAMARKLGHTNHTTVQGWWNNSIPIGHWTAISEAARIHEIELDMAEFLPEAA